MRSMLLRRVWLMWLLAAACLFLWSFTMEGALDIHLHDTYFVVAHRHVFMLPALGLLLFAFLYRSLRSLLFAPLLSWLHLLFTLGCIVVVLMPVPYDGIGSVPRRYYDYSTWESYRSFAELNQMLSIAVVACFFGQLLFLLHILWGGLRLFRRRR